MIETRFTFDTKLNADSVEWCLTPGFEHFLALGAYHVEKNKDQEQFGDNLRSGKLLMFHDKEDQVEMVYEEPTKAILDMKWSTSLPKPSLALTTSSGQLCYYSLQESRLFLESSLDIDPEEKPVLLSLDWNDRKNDQVSSSLRLVLSDSLGKISIVELIDGGCLQKVEDRKIHLCEAWITVFDAWNNRIIYSGGDDCKLFQTDLRTNSSIKIGNHEAGVTSLLSDIHDENRLYSGSYDEVLRSWDKRKTKQPVKTFQAGGGIWRIRQPRNQRQNHLLGLACMHNGFHILSTKSENCFDLVTSYDKHESLAYGLDFKNDPGKVQLASCSFYDSLLNVWDVNLSLLE